MNLTETFLLAMGIIFSVPFLIWRLCKTDYYAPLVVVQIITGILLGPGVLGRIFPNYYEFVFKAPVIQLLNGIAWWAVMLFVMIAGIELDLRQAWSHRRETGVTATLALIAPLCFGALVALGLVHFEGWKGPEAKDWQFILGIGMACAVTALPILILLMEKLEIFRTPLGQRILRYASFDDIAIWGVLAIILMDWQRVERQWLFLGGIILIGTLFRWLMRRIAQGSRWHVLLIWLTFVSLGADWSGLHFMVGAFLAGALVDAEWFAQHEVDRFRNLILLTLMPVFFLSTGLRTEWGVGGSAVFIAAGALLLASVTGKLLGLRLAGMIFKWPKGDAWVLGWLLQTKALIMIIFANILLDKHIITNDTFTALLLMAVVSTMLTSPMVAPRLRRKPSRPLTI